MDVAGGSFAVAGRNYWILVSIFFILLTQTNPTRLLHLLPSLFLANQGFPFRSIVPILYRRASFLQEWLITIHILLLPILFRNNLQSARYQVRAPFLIIRQTLIPLQRARRGPTGHARHRAISPGEIPRITLKVHLWHHHGLAPYLNGVVRAI